MTWPLTTDNPVALNVEPRGLADARLTTGREIAVIAGVMAGRFPTVTAAVSQVADFTAAGIQVSVGLGDGAADQWDRALEVALASRPLHLNQVFPAAGLSQRALADAGTSTLVNALVSPVRNGWVNVATGPLSRRHPTEVPVEAALDLMAEVGVRSVKLYPVGGLDRLDEIVAVARAVAERDLLLEPTGGIAPAHLSTLLDAVLATGCRVMPHLYGSLRDDSGALSPALLDEALAAVAEVLGRR